MSEPGNFLERWSRRKRAAEDESPAAGLQQEQSARAAADEPSAAADGPTADVAQTTGAAKDEAAPFDLSTLPSLESIGAKSDVRAFMQAGVPSELRHAALRRAWSADPGIRDFIGLVENGWDFNDPYGVPGFGPMPEDVDIGSLLAQAIGAAGKPEASSSEPDSLTPPAETQHDPEPMQTAAAETDEAAGKPEDNSSLASGEAVLASGEAVETEILQRGKNYIATQENFDASPPMQRSRHGSALPK